MDQREQKKLFKAKASSRHQTWKPEYEIEGKKLSNHVKLFKSRRQTLLLKIFLHIKENLKDY